MVYIIIFSSVLQNVLMMFILVVIGFFIKKKDLVPDKTASVLSKLELLIFIPALNFSTQIEKCSAEMFKKNSISFVYAFFTVVAVILISYPISHLFIRKNKNTPDENYLRNIYKYAIAFGNYGYFGNFFVEQMWGTNGLSQYLLYTFFFNIFCYGWGFTVLTPKKSGENGILKNLKSGILQPPMISLILGIIGGLLNVKQYIPTDWWNNVIIGSLSKVSDCMGPCAMLLAGMVISEYDFKALFSDKKVYIVSLLRLLLIPALIVSVIKLIGADFDTVKFTLIALCAPLGLNTIIKPASCGGETKTGASMTMISTILSVITVPLMCAVFLECL